jgi:hypothetical protein
MQAVPEQTLYEAERVACRESPKLKLPDKG